jgi:hypothetical protein
MALHEVRPRVYEPPGVGRGRAGRHRVGFYAQIRPELLIKAPGAQYSAYDPATGRHLVIVDDVSRTRGAHFGNIVTRRLEREQAEQVIDTLAALHAQFWSTPLRERFGHWLLDSWEWMAPVERHHQRAPADPGGF